MQLDAADTLFSKYVRKRDKWQCQRCGKQYREGDQGLHCSHFYGRTRESTRFDPENCDALCFSCHKFFDEKDHLAHVEWKKQRLGEERFKMLRIRADSFQKKDRKLALLTIKKMLEEYEHPTKDTN